MIKDTNITIYNRPGRELYCVISKYRVTKSKEYSLTRQEKKWVTKSMG